MIQLHYLNLKNIFIRKSWLFTFLFLTFSKSYSAVCTATLSGNWEDPAVWSCGHVPLCTDNITIPSGFTITLTTVFDYNTGPCTSQPMTMSISGVLNFNTGKRLTLPSESTININETGSLQPGSGGGSSNLITIGEIDIWRAEDGPVSGPAVLSSGVLSIELDYFTGSISENNNINLKWQTATEKNNNYFEVERSNDCITFETISKIQSKSPNGISEQPLNYEIFDLSPQNGINYYRLKQVEFNTTYIHSTIQSVEFKAIKELSFTVFPNPSEGTTVNIVWESPDIEEIVVVVSDVNGKEYSAKVLITKDSKKSIYSIDPSNKLAPGIYTITATSIQAIHCKRFIVN